jgi:hypothetical protein
MAKDEEKKASKPEESKEAAKEGADAAAKEEAAADDSKAAAKKEAAADGEAKEEGDGKKKAAKPKKEKKPPPTPTRTSTRERRTRKEADIFNPEDFTKVDHTVKIIDGRGSRLADLEAVRTHVESLKPASDELAMAHKFLYSGRGKPPAKEMRRNIMLFSGFLVKHDDSVSEEDKKELDDEAEVRVLKFIYSKLSVVPLLHHSYIHTLFLLFSNR